MLPAFPKTNRLGFHYLPDTNHFRNSDLEFWMPELEQMEAAWLILPAPMERAIPEEFLTTILEAGIQPVIHFKPRIASFLDKAALNLFLQQYSRWGIRYAIFYDRPNIRSSWSVSSWSQADLVDRFLDKFISCAELAMDYTITPIFPGLEPGGDYWDLAFLRSSFSSLQRRGKWDLLDHMVLGAFASVIDRPLDWGAGGPARWIEARPYLNQPVVQDHRGFYIYEWYLSLASEILNKNLPVMLFEVGYQSTAPDEEGLNQEAVVAAQTLSLLKRIIGDNIEGTQPEIPAEVIAGCFCLAGSEMNDHHAGLSWYHNDGSPRPLVDAARRWISGQRLPRPRFVHVETNRDKTPENLLTQESPLDELAEELPDGRESPQPVINHYVLLPLYAWGAAEWDFELISPILHDSHPTVGFSLEEASRAERVTIVGGPGVITEEAVALLRNSGCTIERLLENGTIIAS